MQKSEGGVTIHSGFGCGKFSVIFCFSFAGNSNAKVIDFRLRPWFNRDKYKNIEGNLAKHERCKVRFSFSVQRQIVGG